MPQSITYLWPIMIEPDQTDDGVIQPLAEWANPPKLSDLKQHLEDARSLHMTQQIKIDGYLDNMNVTGKATLPKSTNGSSRIQPRLIRKQAEWRYAALSEPFLSSSDIFNVSPVSWEDADAAKQNQVLLNNQFNTKIDKVAFIDTYVRTAVDEGTVIVRVGWEFQEEDYTDKVPVVEFHFDQSFGPALQHATDLLQQSASPQASGVPDEMVQAVQISQQQGQPYRPVITGWNEVTKKRTVKNQPTLEVCDYRNVVLDPSARGDITKAQFLIYSFETSLSDLKKDGRYKNLDKINVANNSPLSQIDHASELAPTNFNFADKPRTKFVAYEYWGYWDIDGSGETKSIVCTWVGDVLIRMEENPYPDKQIPFVVVQYLPVRRANYGEPDGALLEDNQKIIGAVTRGMIDLMGKSANAQTGTRKDALDITNRRKYERGEDYEFNPSVNPAEAFFMHKFPDIPQSAPLMLQMQQAEAESMTGVKSFSQGMTGNSLGDVAAGVRGALDAASKREIGILRRLANGVVQIARKFIAMNAVFLSEEEVVRVTNEQFVTIRRDDLPGNFDLKLSISTAEEDDNKARELAFMLQTIGPNDQSGVRQIILADICRLRKMPDLAQKLENYKPQPDPMAQQMQQLQMQLVQSEINLNNAQAQAAGSNAQLHVVKAGTEQVKAAHIKADTDQKNLNFVEQESGVTHARDLQKQQAAADNQAALASQAHVHDLVGKAVDQQHEVGMAAVDHASASQLQKEAPQPVASNK